MRTSCSVRTRTQAAWSKGQVPRQISAVTPGPIRPATPRGSRGPTPRQTSRASASSTTAPALLPYSVSVARLNRKASGGTPRKRLRSARMRGPARSSAPGQWRHARVDNAEVQLADVTRTSLGFRLVDGTTGVHSGMVQHLSREAGHCAVREPRYFRSAGARDHVADLVMVHPPRQVRGFPQGERCDQGPRFPVCTERPGICSSRTVSCWAPRSTLGQPVETRTPKPAYRSTSTLRGGPGWWTPEP